MEWGGRGDFVVLKKKHVPGKVRNGMEISWKFVARRRAKRRDFWDRTEREGLTSSLYCNITLPFRFSQGKYLSTLDTRIAT
jgi:hypothetical protein